MELGSDEHNHVLLTEIATIVSKIGVPWDPFNIELVVRAQKEPEQKIKFYKPSELKWQLI